MSMVWRTVGSPATKGVPHRLGGMHVQLLAYGRITRSSHVYVQGYKGLQVD